MAYGQDMPMDDALLEDITDPIPTAPVEPIDLPFEYGEEILTEITLDYSLTRHIQAQAGIYSESPAQQME